MEKYTGFIYLWYDRKRKWFCIGSHNGTVDDGYITSTGYMIRAYKKRPEDFKRRILHYHNGDPKSLHDIEQQFLDRIQLHELCNNENIEAGTTRYYNMKKNAAGLSGEIASKLKTDYWNDSRSDEHRESNRQQRIKYNSSRRGQPSWNTGIKCPQISAAMKGKISTIPFELRSERIKAAWERGCFDSRPKPTEEHKRKISESGRALNRKQTDFQKQRAREANSAPKSEEHKKNLSIAAKQRYENKPPVVCPHCGHEGKGANIYRYHFKNCTKAEVL